MKKQINIGSPKDRMKLLLPFILMVALSPSLFALNIESAVEPVPERVIIVPADHFYVDIWTDRTSYYPGDRIRIYFRSSRDAYIFIFDTDTYGVTRQLFPNWYDRDNYVRAQTTYSIPDYRYDLEVTGPSGKEFLQVVAVQSRYRFFDHYLRFRSGDPFPRVPHGPRAMIDELERGAEIVPDSEFSYPESYAPDAVEPHRVVPVPRPPRPPHHSQRYAEDTTSFYVREVVYRYERDDPYRWTPPDKPEYRFYIGRKGELRIRSCPSDARIYIDSKYYGKTTKTIDLPAGWHRLSLTRNGYYDWSDWVLVEPGKKDSVYINLVHIVPGHRPPDRERPREFDRREPYVPYREEGRTYDEQQRRDERRDQQIRPQERRPTPTPVPTPTPFTAEQNLPGQRRDDNSNRSTRNDGNQSNML